MKCLVIGFCFCCTSISSILSAYTPTMNSPLHDSSSNPPRLVYNGGPVITNVKIVDVLWGSKVNTNTKNSLPGYFEALISSSWIDGFTTYNSIWKSDVTTNQAIGNGSYIGQYMINPAKQKGTITEADIQNELIQQLNQNHLPQPEYDDQGYPDTVYMIEFPSNLTIIANNGSVSCIDFCAFHNTLAYHGKPILYSVHPDFSKGCASGCGPGNRFENQEMVHSHELAAMILNPLQGAGIYSWYDEVYGEAGDICLGIPYELVSNGTTYTLQQEWSNVRNQCLGTLPSIPSPIDFTGEIVVEGTSISHVLSWEPSPTPYLNGYRIVEGGLVVAVTSADGPYIVSIPNRDPASTYTYRIAAYNDSGIQSPYQVVTLP